MSLEICHNCPFRRRIIHVTWNVPPACLLWIRKVTQSGRHKHNRWHLLCYLCEACWTQEERKEEVCSRLLCHRRGEERKEEAKRAPLSSVCAHTPADWVINDLWGGTETQACRQGERGTKDSIWSHILLIKCIILKTTFIYRHPMSEEDAAGDMLSLSPGFTVWVCFGKQVGGFTSFRGRDQAERGERCGCMWLDGSHRELRGQRDGGERQLSLVLVTHPRRAETKVALSEMRYEIQAVTSSPCLHTDYISWDNWRSSLWFTRYYSVSVIIRGTELIRLSAWERWAWIIPFGSKYENIWSIFSRYYKYVSVILS